jgi:integrase/recombinase XerD
VLLSEAVSEFLAVRKVKLSPSARQQYEWTLDQFLERCGAVTTDSLKESTIAAYVEWLGQPRKDGSVATSKTVITYYKIVHTFLSWCVREDILPARVLRVEPPRVTQAIPATFQDGQITKLAKMAGATGCGDALKARDVALVWLLADTGMRASELCGLTLDNLNLAEGYCLVLGKGRKYRQVGPLSGKTVRALRSWLGQRPRYKPQGDQVFCSRIGTPLNRWSLYTLLRRLGQKVDVRTGCHKFRHSYARSQALAGADTLAISRLMGHTKLQTTAAYLGQFSSADARRMVGSVVDSL